MSPIDIKMISVPWGSKEWIFPLWPSTLAPEWARTAAKRMEDMGVTVERINEVLKEMMESRTNPKVRADDGTEYKIMCGGGRR